MRLNEMQTKFRDTMLDHPDAVQNPSCDFSAWFETGTIPLSERLKVYRNNIVGGVTDVLIATFPITEKLVGHAFLEGMARSFLLENPPQKGCLNDYGEGFDEFVKNFDPAKDLPYLADVVRLELALNRAYYAEDDTPLTAVELAKVEQESLSNLKLELRSSAQLIQSQFPLDDIRDFCLQEQPKDSTLDMQKGGVKLMVFRPHLKVSIVSLQDDEYGALHAIDNKSSLGEAVKQTMKDYPDFDVQNFLSRHIELETFSTLSTNT